MNGTKALLDSNIIIYLSKNILNIDDFFEKYNEFYISIITYMEVLGYNFKIMNEKQMIKDFLNKFQIVNVDLHIANTVISIREKQKIKLPDAIILATAELKGSDLLTRNISDFENILKTVKIVNPFKEN